jgi:hypothetical protein
VLQELFKASDENEDGRISFTQLHSVLNNELGLGARAEQVKPLFDTFDLGDEGSMSFEEFVDFLVTHLRIKFGGTIAHLVTNAKAFADYVGVANERRDDVDRHGTHMAQRRALVAMAIASDACTEDGRRTALHALTIHAAPPSSKSGPGSSLTDLYHVPRSLLLPNLQLPRRATFNVGAVEESGEDFALVGDEGTATTGDVEAEAKHVLAVSLSRLLDCPTDTVSLHSDPSEPGGVESVTVSASVGGLGDVAIGRALAMLVNGDLHNAKLARQRTAEISQELQEKDSRIIEVR